MVGGEGLSSVVLTSINGESITLGNQAPYFLERIDGVGSLGVELENQKSPNQDGELEKELEWNDKEYITVPNVIGMSLVMAKKALSNFDVQVVGDGNKVTYQSIDEGEKIEIGSRIRILLK